MASRNLAKAEQQLIDWAVEAQTATCVVVVVGATLVDVKTSSNNSFTCAS